MIQKTFVQLNAPFIFFFLFIYMGVRDNLRAPQLIARPTEHPANPMSM